MTLPLGILSVLFALVFTFLPYALYFECMQKTNVEILNRLLPFVCIATVLGEMFVTGSAHTLLAAPLIGIFLWLYRPSVQ